MPSSVVNTAPMPAANVFLTSSGTRPRARCADRLGQVAERRRRRRRRVGARALARRRVGSSPAPGSGGSLASGLGRLGRHADRRLRAIMPADAPGGAGGVRLPSRLESTPPPASTGDRRSRAAAPPAGPHLALRCKAYWVTFLRHRQLPVGCGCRRASAPRRGSMRLLRAQAPAQRAPHRAHDHRAAGPVHQGRPAHQHHDQLPARGVPRASSRGCRTRCRRARTTTSRRASARSSAAARRTSCSRSFERAADRVGVDRPGPRRAACTTAARSRSRCSTPTSRRSCAATCARCAASSASSSWFVPYQGLDERLPRDPRDACWPSSTSAPRPTTSTRIARELRGPHRRRVPAVVARAVDRARADHALRERAARSPTWPRVKRARHRSRRSSRARSSRSTASRSSPTASITPIRTPETCSCAPRRRASRRRSCSSTSARSPRSRRRCAQGIVELHPGRADARHARASCSAMKQMGFVARGADEQRVRAGDRVLPRALPGEHLARLAQPQGHQVRPAEGPREPRRPAPHGHLAARAVGELPRPEGDRSSSSARCSC